MPESLTPDLLSLRDRAQAFIDDELRPLERTLGDDVNAPVPDDTRRQVRESSRDAGFFGMTQPVEFGGASASPMAMLVARETFAAANSPLTRFVFGPGPGILHAAEGRARELFLEPLLRGEKTGAWAFTEPSDASRPTHAKRDGEDLLVTGRKSFVTGGATADFYSVFVNVEEDDSGPGGAAIVVIERDTPGLAIERIFDSMDGGSHIELGLNDARVPLANVVGKIGEGMPRAIGSITEERIESAATASGMMLWAVDYVTRHITAPHRSGVRLGDREGVRLRYADMRIEAYAARSMLYRTGRLLEGGEDAMNEVMASKIFCTEVAGRIVDQAVQLVGGQALIVGHPLERLYRRVRSMRLSGGASDILRMNIARGVIEFDAGRL